MCVKQKILLLTTLILCFIACSVDHNQIQPLSETEKAEISAIGDKAAATLIKTLQSELLTAIGNKGVTGAIDVCSVHAIKMTDSLTMTIDRIEKIKRTSTKIRNPLNKADDLENDALQYFTKDPDNARRFSRVYIQKLNDKKGPFYRYYKPLQIKPLCLSCHGPQQEIATELAVKLKNIYPEDMAIGYKIDDFRGIISVTIR